jgi:hypothetical protein
MGLFFRSMNIAGRFPFVRLLQLRDNPAYLFEVIKRNLIDKHDKTDYRPHYKPFTFLTAQQTLQHMIDHNQSLARFSDGEIGQIMGAGEYPPDSDWCQRWSKPLADDLIKVLRSTDPRLMVAVDPPSTFLASRDSVHHIRFEYNMWFETRMQLWKYLQPKINYGHCHLFIKANCPDFNWAQLRDYLRDKDIIVATGLVHKLRHLRLGRRTFFIECGTENAYEKKDKIRSSIISMIDHEKLEKQSTIVFASLGPTACILAHELLDSGIRIWDTGHMFEFAAENFIESVFNANAA